jgi:hypothetical protein
MLRTVGGHFRATLRRLPTLTLIVLAAGYGGIALADTTYWRVTIDRVTVVTDGNAQRCSRLAAQFLAFEAILRELADWSPDYAPPPVALYSLSQQDALRVLLSDSERQRQRSNGMMIYSKYLPGRDFNINAIVDEGGSDDPMQSVLLLYAEGLLTTGPTQRHPPWFQLGVANLLNGLIIRSDGSVILNRTLPFEPTTDGDHRPQAHYDLEKLLSLRTADFGPALDYKEFMRRAREWAQFGLLTTDERRSRYRELATLMRQGEPVGDAVKDVFGIPLQQVAAEFEAGAWRKEVQFRLAAHTSLPLIPAPAKLESSEANILLQVVAARAARDRPEAM